MLRSAPLLAAAVVTVGRSSTVHYGHIHSLAPLGTILHVGTSGHQFCCMAGFCVLVQVLCDISHVALRLSRLI